MANKLHISEDFRKILNEIKDLSIIAKAFLEPDGFINTQIEPDLQINYIDVSESDRSKISYLPISRVSPDSDPWKQRGRYFARPSSVISKIFNKFDDREVELFTNLFKSVSNQIKFTLKVVDGEAIRTYYHLDTYRSQSGSLGNSCMKWENCQNFMDIYVHNPDTISMLIMIDEDRNKILGRALLWNFDDNKVMDRIYTINDEDYAFHFKLWAKNNGYIYKHEQRWNNSLEFQVDGVKTIKRFSIKLNNLKHNKYPYMDTFKFIDFKAGLLHNFIPHDIIETLCGSDGRLLDYDYLAEDCFTHIFFLRNETVPILYDENGLNPKSRLRAHSYDTNWSHVNNLFIHKADAVYNDEVDDYLFTDKLSHLNDVEKIEKVKNSKKEMSPTLENADEITHREAGVIVTGTPTPVRSMPPAPGRFRTIADVERVWDVQTTDPDMDSVPSDTADTGYIIPVGEGYSPGEARAAMVLGTSMRWGPITQTLDIQNTREG